VQEDSLERSASLAAHKVGSTTELVAMILSNLYWGMLLPALRVNWLWNDEAARLVWRQVRSYADHQPFNCLRSSETYMKQYYMSKIWELDHHFESEDAREIIHCCQFPNLRALNLRRTSTGTAMDEVGGFLEPTVVLLTPKMFGNLLSPSLKRLQFVTPGMGADLIDSTRFWTEITVPIPDPLPSCYCH
jgi:hypothetical protein